MVEAAGLVVIFLVQGRRALRPVQNELPLIGFVPDRSQFVS